jgi:hypothetical protein
MPLTADFYSKLQDLVEKRREANLFPHTTQAALLALKKVRQRLAFKRNSKPPVPISSCHGTQSLQADT